MCFAATAACILKNICADDSAVDNYLEFLLFHAKFRLIINLFGMNCALGAVESIQLRMGPRTVRRPEK